LPAVAAEFMHGLRRQADVRHHGNLFADKATNNFGAVASAFELDSFRARFDELQGVAHGVVCACVVRAVGHVGDEQCALDAGADGARVVNHVVERDVDCVLVTEHDVGERVADEDDVGSGFVNDARGRVVVSREADKRFAAFFDKA
jgi:hypothetical protein